MMLFPILICLALLLLLSSSTFAQELRLPGYSFNVDSNLAPADQSFIAEPFVESKLEYTIYVGPSNTLFTDKVRAFQKGTRKGRLYDLGSIPLLLYVSNPANLTLGECNCSVIEKIETRSDLQNLHDWTPLDVYERSNNVGGIDDNLLIVIDIPLLSNINMTYRITLNSTASPVYQFHLKFLTDLYITKSLQIGDAAESKYSPEQIPLRPWYVEYVFRPLIEDKDKIMKLQFSFNNEAVDQSKVTTNAFLHWNRVPLQESRIENSGIQTTIDQNVLTIDNIKLNIADSLFFYLELQITYSWSDPFALGKKIVVDKSYWFEFTMEAAVYYNSSVAVDVARSYYFNHYEGKNHLLLENSIPDDDESTYSVLIPYTALSEDKTIDFILALNGSDIPHFTVELYDKKNNLIPHSTMRSLHTVTHLSVYDIPSNYSHILVKSDDQEIYKQKWRFINPDRSTVDPTKASVLNIELQDDNDYNNKFSLVPPFKQGLTRYNITYFTSILGANIDYLAVSFQLARDYSNYFIASIQDGISLDDITQIPDDSLRFSVNEIEFSSWESTVSVILTNTSSYIDEIYEFVLYPEPCYIKSINIKDDREIGYTVSDFNADNRAQQQYFVSPSLNEEATALYITAQLPEKSNCQVFGSFRGLSFNNFTEIVDQIDGSSPPSYYVEIDLGELRSFVANNGALHNVYFGISTSIYTAYTLNLDTTQLLPHPRFSSIEIWPNSANEELNKIRIRSRPAFSPEISQFEVAEVLPDYEKLQFIVAYDPNIYKAASIYAAIVDIPGPAKGERILDQIIIPNDHGAEFSIDLSVLASHYPQIIGAFKLRITLENEGIQGSYFYTVKLPDKTSGATLKTVEFLISSSSEGNFIPFTSELAFSPNKTAYELSDLPSSTSILRFLVEPAKEEQLIKFEVSDDSDSDHDIGLDSLGHAGLGDDRVSFTVNLANLAEVYVFRRRSSPLPIADHIVVKIITSLNRQSKEYIYHIKIAHLTFTQPTKLYDLGIKAPKKINNFYSTSWAIAPQFSAQITNYEANLTLTSISPSALVFLTNHTIEFEFAVYLHAPNPVLLFPNNSKLLLDSQFSQLSKLTQVWYSYTAKTARDSADLVWGSHREDAEDGKTVAQTKPIAVRLAFRSVETEAKTFYFTVKNESSSVEYKLSLKVFVDNSADQRGVMERVVDSVKEFVAEQFAIAMAILTVIGIIALAVAYRCCCRSKSANYSNLQQFDPDAGDVGAFEGRTSKHKTIDLSLEDDIQLTGFEADTFDLENDDEL
jgi:hypothetical protein